MPTALPVRAQQDELSPEFLAVIALALSPLLILAIAMFLTRAEPSRPLGIVTAVPAISE